MPFFSTCKNACSSESATLKLGIDSNLSNVPPVCPKPLPLIFITGKPREAVKGASTRVVVSPTPPVLCLSTFMPFIELKSNVLPELVIAIVSCEVSSISIPLR